MRLDSDCLPIIVPIKLRDIATRTLAILAADIRPPHPPHTHTPDARAIARDQHRQAKWTARQWAQRNSCRRR